MRVALGVFGVFATTLSFAACGGDDPAATTEEDGGSSSSSSSSSGGSSSGDADGGTSSGGDGGGDASVPVGDGGLGSGCNVDAECASKVCGVGKKCVEAPSCRSSNGAAPGIDTCGAAEPGNESCCTSLTLPTTTTRTLDRYEITAGRVRAFIEAVAAANGGTANIKKVATDYAAAHPTSQLGKLVTAFPGYLDILPTSADVLATPSLEMYLGAFPFDAINQEDGCYISAGGYGAATYWQPPKDLKPYRIGYGAPPDGTRKYAQNVLDTKAANCMPPIFLATFCAWDGGELARTSDYREVWGRNPVALAGGPTVFIPWTAILKPGEFNWRNGHDGACPTGWPGCTNGVAPVFFSFPTGGQPKDDDSPEIGAPGRFPKDVTKAVSPDGNRGWIDVGGNLMEAAWPNTALVPATKDVCDTSAGSPANAQLKCNRDQSAADKRPGTLRFKGNTPPIALVGYSFEVHARRSEAYLASTTDDETKIADGDIKPAHFQYGKVGGRCARVK